MWTWNNRAGSTAALLRISSCRRRWLRLLRCLPWCRWNQIKIKPSVTSWGSFVPSVTQKVRKQEEKPNILQILRPGDEFSPIFMSTGVFLCDSSRLKEHKSCKKSCLTASSSCLHRMRLHKCSRVKPLLLHQENNILKSNPASHLGALLSLRRPSVTQKVGKEQQNTIFSETQGLQMNLLSVEHLIFFFILHLFNNKKRAYFPVFFIICMHFNSRLNKGTNIRSLKCEIGVSSW